MNSEKLCEKALLELAEGNTDALSVIYGEMSRRIFSLAYTVTGNYCDAEDVLQNTMIDITRSCREYCGGSIVAWIMTITRHNALDVVRKRREAWKWHFATFRKARQRMDTTILRLWRLWICWPCLTTMRSR